MSNPKNILYNCYSIGKTLILAFLCLSKIVPLFYPKIIDIYNKWAENETDKELMRWQNMWSVNLFDNKYKLQCMLHGHIHGIKEFIHDKQGNTIAVHTYCPRCGKDGNICKVVGIVHH